MVGVEGVGVSREDFDDPVLPMEVVGYEMQLGVLGVQGEAQEVDLNIKI